MKKFIRLLPIVASLLLVSTIAVRSAVGQGPKRAGGSRSTVNTGGTLSAGPATASKRGPYLSLEPCEKETVDQIAELENAKDVGSQLRSLELRAGDNNEWVRACAVYRLGQFGPAAQSSLMLIIKLLKDENNADVWSQVESALWKIPPDPRLSLEQRVKLSQDPDVYIRLYGLYALACSNPLRGSLGARETLKTLLAATDDGDNTVCWMAVMGIREIGFSGVDTSPAIPVLSKLLSSGRIDPVVPLRAFVPMKEKAMPAGPVLLDVLFNPGTYVKDDQNNRSYGLYLTTAIVLGGLGESLVPLLEQKSQAKPIAVIKVLSNMASGKALDLLLKLAEDRNPKVRAEAISNLPGLTSLGAIEALPVLLRHIDEKAESVSEAVMDQIGNIGQYTQDKSAELRTMIRSKVVPRLMAKLRFADNCYALMALGKLVMMRPLLFPQ